MKVQLTVKPNNPKDPSWRLHFLEELDRWLRETGWVKDFEIVIAEAYPTVVSFKEKEASP